ncbi:MULTISPECIES: endolytic transglycosylase MltG [unclassified Exiguobacterium]|uniref:endolytic transglycosylase MltG n=1 Tax=unclassified Exiguobacterium TaxID=2644629 RepID=UPI000DF850FA|nr:MULTISPECIES: endolytic transglycosylase MltG [unclassified Exiguobacterium]RDB33598.1 endolytic transglycosylase MltG [Exiguobacterium sp. RIT594]HCN56960.1 endolytic transglycosylase MltG [Exiguobacterium sp.]
MENEWKKNAEIEQKRRRTSRRITLIILSVLFTIFLVAGAAIYIFLKSSLEPVNEEATKSVKVEIPLGAGTSTISSILKEKDLIANETIFRYYVRYKNESSFQAGTYTLTQAMTPDEIINELKTGTIMKAADVKITIPEGITMDRQIAIIAKATGFKADSIRKSLTDEAYIKTLIDKYPMLTDEVTKQGVLYSLEGYLFPATYEFDKGKSINQIAETMLDETEKIYDENTDAIKKSGMTFHEVLSLGSMVEREAATPDDRREIAGVFTNRLNDGMKLQSDPTVWYGTGENTALTTLKDLENNSKYNTYKYEGIPIGPISTVSKDSILAVLNPKKTKYVYFFARPPSDKNPRGQILYEETYEEHQRNVVKYKPEWVEYEASKEQ